MTAADTYARVVARSVWQDNGHATGPCLVWLGAVNADGYGVTRTHGGYALTHRLAVLVRDGHLDDGLTVDHLCYVRRCCHPLHLEPVTRGMNIRRAYAHRAAQQLA